MPAETELVPPLWGGLIIDAGSNRIPSPLVGEGKGGGSISREFFKHPAYFRYNAIGILQDFVVPEPDNAKTLALKPIGATLVVNSLPSFSMLPTIEFDDEAWAKAREIDDVIANQGLATEAQTSELFISQPLPK